MRQAVKVSDSHDAAAPTINQATLARNMVYVSAWSFKNHFIVLSPRTLLPPRGSFQDEVDLPIHSQRGLCQKPHNVHAHECLSESDGRGYYLL